MIYILMTDGRLLEFDNAESVEVENDWLTLGDCDGHVIASMHTKQVTAYGNDEMMAQYRETSAG